jgi:L-alanine-DL-glutamate epimerase-like enolase superfamily enzyme
MAASGRKISRQGELYADTPGARDPQAFAETMKKRVDIQGFTWLKMDLGIHVVANQPDSLVNNKFWDGAVGQYDLRDYMGYGNTLHPFTQVQITDKGLEGLAEYVEQVRNAVGYEMPLCADHFGHFDINNSIRFGRAMDKYRLHGLKTWFHGSIPNSGERFPMLWRLLLAQEKTSIALIMASAFD